MKVELWMQKKDKKQEGKILFFFPCFHQEVSELEIQTYHNLLWSFQRPIPTFLWIWIVKPRPKTQTP